MEFKDIVSSLRQQTGLTLEEVGNRVGVSKATVKRWESGEIENVRRDKIKKLADAFGTTPSVLMGWEPIPFIPKSDNSEFHKIMDGLVTKIVKETENPEEYLKLLTTENLFEVLKLLRTIKEK